MQTLLRPPRPRRSPELWYSIILTAVFPYPDLLQKRACTQTYTVVSGDTCSKIEAQTGVSDATLHTLNPGINSGCTNLQIGQVLCISNGGSGCSQTYTVVSGDTCGAIEARFGITDAQLHTQNPSINSGCTSTIPAPFPCQLR
ncbi:hypothetical protein C8R45DRAFT_845998 [Mycena sanguinolenta]|nr:hypothetical protein C8R45DRAFT_845998 [Mycena sanguinolenta]